MFLSILFFSKCIVYEYIVQLPFYNDFELSGKI